MCERALMSMSARGPIWSVLSLLLSSCYLSHGRSQDGGSPQPDAGVDARPHEGGCDSRDLRVDARLVFLDEPGLGSLIVNGRSGELFHDGHGGDHRFDLCIDAGEAPLTLEFAQQGGPNLILGVTSDFVGEAWGRGVLIEPDFDMEVGELARQEPDSVFTVHVTPRLVQTIVRSPFITPCDGVLSPCRIRFIEVSTDGRLLGGGAFDHRGGHGSRMVLDGRGTSTDSRRFEVELPRDGLLAGLPLVDVRPMDCRGPVGPAYPGELDLWRCSYAGVADFEISDGVARGTVQFVRGPDVVADHLMARVADESSGLDAHVLVPCCTAPDSEPLQLSFPLARRLDAHLGERAEALSIEIDAPGYVHAAAWYRSDGSTHRIFGFEPNGQLSMPQLPPYSHAILAGTPPPRWRELWISAVTTEEGRKPWEAGLPRAMVRRIVLP